jgi:hypothetical protein
MQSITFSTLHTDQDIPTNDIIIKEIILINELPLIKCIKNDAEYVVHLLFDSERNQFIAETIVMPEGTAFNINMLSFYQNTSPEIAGTNNECILPGINNNNKIKCTIVGDGQNALHVPEYTVEENTQLHKVSFTLDDVKYALDVKNIIGDTVIVSVDVIFNNVILRDVDVILVKGDLCVVLTHATVTKD